MAMFSCLHDRQKKASPNLSDLLRSALSSLAANRKQRRQRCFQAEADVVELLKDGHYQRALLWVERVIKEENMIDALFLVENYCQIFMERILLFNMHKTYPAELKASVVSILFFSIRYGELKELAQIQKMLTKKLGKTFVTSVSELRQHTDVDLTMVQKMSILRPSLDTKIKALKEIAAANMIEFNIVEDSSNSGVNFENSYGQEKYLKYQHPIQERKDNENQSVGSPQDTRNTGSEDESCWSTNLYYSSDDGHVSNTDELEKILLED